MNLDGLRERLKQERRTLLLEMTESSDLSPDQLERLADLHISIDAISAQIAAEGPSL
jgi:hypothetical protein